MTDRYQRQTAFAPFGEAGQRALSDARVLVVGCGGLGAAACMFLARAGVGALRVVDPDRVACSNLHRQVLFDEADLGAPKVEVARRKLLAISAGLAIEARVASFGEKDADELLRDVSLVIDGTDNLAARYAINDACLRRDLPWIYGGVEGATGMTLTVLPGQGPCFACLFPRAGGDPPPAAPAGRPVLGPVPAIVAGMQVVQACRVLAGDGTPPALLQVDLWEQRWQRVVVARDPACGSCGGR